MGKKIKILTFLFFFSVTVNAQVYLDSLKKQANNMIIAVKKGNFNTVLNYTHPKIIMAMGGNEKALQTVKTAMNILKKQKIVISSISVGPIVQSLINEETIQCIIPQFVEVRMNGKISKSKNYLFCISYNHGKKWYFLDTAPLKGVDIRTIIPEASKDIKIPKSEID